MRYLLKEQPYERPLAAGTLVYEREFGMPGVLEHWRLTEALDGYRFFRIDLDERAAAKYPFSETGLNRGDQRRLDGSVQRP